jgi:hypothetical protein
MRFCSPLICSQEVAFLRQAAFTALSIYPFWESLVSNTWLHNLHTMHRHKNHLIYRALVSSQRETPTVLESPLKKHLEYLSALGDT